MTITLIARSDWPIRAVPFTIDGTGDNVSVETIKQTAAKTLSLPPSHALRSTFYAIQYGHDVIELGRGSGEEEKTTTTTTATRVVPPTSIKVVDNMTIVVAAPADLKPLPRGLVVEKEEEKAKKTTKRPAQIYAGLTPENALEKYTGSSKQKRIVLEYIDMEIMKIMQTKAWLSLPESTLITILSSDTLNASEVDLFDGVVAWGKYQLTKDAPTSSPDTKVDDAQLKTVLQNVLPLIRFPLMTTQDIAVKVNPSNLLDQTQILELFTYLGVLETNKKGAKLGSSIASFNAKKRIGRRPPGWFKWDDEKKYSALQLTDEGTTVTCTSTSYYQSIFGNVELEDGVHEWELTLETLYQHQFGCIIGVVPSSFTNYTVSQMIGYPGHIPGWGYSAGGAQKFHTDQTAYGRVCSSGDVVRVKLDLDAGTLELFVNGESLGAAYTDIVGPVRPAMSLYGQNTVKLKVA